MYREGSDVLLVTTGIGLRVCRETADLLEKRRVRFRASSTDGQAAGYGDVAVRHG